MELQQLCSEDIFTIVSVKIFESLSKFSEIVDKNKPSELSTEKSGQEKNLYM